MNFPIVSNAYVTDYSEQLDNQPSSFGEFLGIPSASSKHDQLLEKKTNHLTQIVRRETQLNNTDQDTIDIFKKILQTVLISRDLDLQFYAQLKIQYSQAESYIVQLKQELEKRQVQISEKQREMLKAKTIINNLNKSLSSKELSLQQNQQHCLQLETDCQQLVAHLTQLADRITHLEKELKECRQEKQLMINVMNKEFHEQAFLQPIVNINKNLPNTKDENIKKLHSRINTLQQENKSLKNKLKKAFEISTVVEELLIKENK